MNEKECTTCKEMLLVNSDNFRKDTRGKFGVRSKCRRCERKYLKAYRVKNKKRNSKKEKERHKKYRKNNKEKIKEYGQKYYDNNYKRFQAYKKVKKALASGEIKRKNICSNCGDNKSNMELHHPDYDKPLLVIELCKSCHKRLHNKLRKGN